MSEQKTEQNVKQNKNIKSKFESIRICRETLSFMIKLAWRKKPVLFLLYIVNLCIDVFNRTWEILLPKLLMDELQLFLSGAETTQHLHNICMYAAISVGAEMLASIISIFSNNQGKNVLDEWFSEYIDIEIAQRAMGMDFEHTEDPDALDVLNKAREGMSWYSGGVVGVLDQLYNMISNIVVICGGAAVVILTCPLLFPVQLAALLLFLYFNMQNNRIEVESFEKLSKRNRIFGYIFYTLSEFCYAKDIRLYNSAGMMGKKADDHAEEMYDAWREEAMLTRGNSWAMDVVNALRDAISYFYIGYLAITGRITLGDFSMCVAAASVLYQSLFAISSGMQNLTKSCNYAHRYLDFLEYPEAMEKGTRPVKKGEHTIEFVNVSFKYPRAGKYVLREINLTIKSGEHLSIVGLNGAGKTTLVKLLCRLYDVTDGAILIDGVDIREYSEEEYRRLFAVVFQDFKLFAFSLKENIALEDADNSSQEKIDDILQLTGLYEDAQKLSEGMDTMIFKSYDENGTELSGGQQQKTAIARALYRDAPVVILDEPTAALDPIAEYEIYRQFETLVGGKTAIYISHRLSSCRFCDKIAVIADDTIREYGSHDELVAIEGGIYAEMFHEQAKYYVDIA